MIKRVFWVALFTGLSHLISLITISYVIRNLGEEVSGYIGIIDSSVILVASVVSFGIQLAVNRNVATKSSWKSNYQLAQSARLTLSLFVIIFGAVLYLLNSEMQYLIYAFAPLVALNGDYALYGNGKPITASSLSFLRVAAPNLGILAASYLGGLEVIYIYIILLAIGIFLAGLIAARANQVPYFILPRKHFLKFYYKYWKVGAYQVASALIVPGILVIADWFYAIAIIGLINGLLKILIVYKGGLRIIVQTFFKELSIEKTEEKIDKASLIAWGAVSIPIIIYYKTTLTLLFENKYDEIAILLPVIGVIMFLGAFRNASEARALILKRDNLNLIVFLTALLLQTIVLVAFSFTPYFIWGIPLALLIAELTVVIGLGYGLHKWHYFKRRFNFLLKLVPPLAIALILKFLFTPSILILSLSITIYLIWSFIFFRKLIFGSLTDLS
jgi:O-antigen/teichoic acid export membrane protein